MVPFRFFHLARKAAAGMQSGAILDSQISSSSEYGVGYRDHRARLHFQASSGAGSWLANGNDVNPWLQVDLLQTTRVIGIATQGRNDFSQWVKEYKLQYGENGQTFTFYRRDGDHSDTVCKICLYVYDF